MNLFIRGLLCVLLLSQSSSASMASPQQEASNRTTPGVASFDPKTTLEDGTPVKLRISQTISSADAHVNDRVGFEVIDDIKVANVVIIPEGGIAWGTVAGARPKRWAGRGGKLEIMMDSVRLADGQKAALRATKEVKGGGHAGIMTAGIIASGLLFFPVAPLFLFIHGKDISIPKGTEVSTFINGNFALDMGKLKPAETDPAATAVLASSDTQVDSNSELVVSSAPPGADIELDGAFIGNTPSTFTVAAGVHTITMTKVGFATWNRTIRISGGSVQISADLKAIEGAPTQPSR